MSDYSDLISQFLWHLPVNWTALAQTITDPDLMGQIQKSWSHFIQTGQVWALLIGLVIGYIIRNLTSYG
jgi:ABC-type arginine/histidine transport system permease subunit